MNRIDPTKQRGAVLLISLVMLLIITLLAVSSMREVTLEERIVGNQRNQQAAFNGAESALREGEKRLTLRIEPAEPTADCQNASGLCVMNSAPTSLHINDWSWWLSGANAMAYSGSNTTTSGLSRLISTPRWNTAFQGFDPADSRGRVEVTDPELRSRGVGPYYYQVNAASQGRNDQIMINLQSIALQRY